jgi:hypothetical protein
MMPVAPLASPGPLEGLLRRRKSLGSAAALLEEEDEAGAAPPWDMLQRRRSSLGLSSLFDHAVPATVGGAVVAGTARGSGQWAEGMFEELGSSTSPVQMVPSASDDEMRLGSGQPLLEALISDPMFMSGQSLGGKPEPDIMVMGGTTACVAAGTRSAAPLGALSVKIELFVVGGGIELRKRCRRLLLILQVALCRNLAVHHLPRSRRRRRLASVECEFAVHHSSIVRACTSVAVGVGLAKVELAVHGLVRSRCGLLGSHRQGCCKRLCAFLPSTVHRHIRVHDIPLVRIVLHHPQRRRRRRRRCRCWRWWPGKASNSLLHIVASLLLLLLGVGEKEGVEVKQAITTRYLLLVLLVLLLSGGAKVFVGFGVGVALEQVGTAPYLLLLLLLSGGAKVFVGCGEGIEIQHIIIASTTVDKLLVGLPRSWVISHCACYSQKARSVVRREAQSIGYELLLAATVEPLVPFEHSPINYATLKCT